MPRKAPVTDHMIQEYLDMTTGGRRLTVGSYLHYTLAGKASRYSSRYQARMVRRLISMRGESVVQVPSIHGGISYVRRCRTCGGTMAPYPVAACPCTCHIQEGA